MPRKKESYESASAKTYWVNEATGEKTLWNSSQVTAVNQESGELTQEVVNYLDNKILSTEKVIRDLNRQ